MQEIEVYERNLLQYKTDILANNVVQILTYVTVPSYRKDGQIHDFRPSTSRDHFELDNHLANTECCLTILVFIKYVLY